MKQKFQLTSFFPQFANTVFLYIQQVLILFTQKHKKNKKYPKSEMSKSECQVVGCLQGNWICKISSLNLQRWSSMSLLGGPQ